MPVFTAAIAAVVAVGAATGAAATVAAVATAVVAVSAAVGVAGLAVTAVGMVTGNKDLLKIGKIMGYVGLAGAVAGGAIGGIGGLMEGGAGILEGAKGAYVHASEKLAEAWQGSIFNPSDSAAVAGGVPEAGAAGADKLNAFGQSIPAAEPHNLYNGELTGTVPYNTPAGVGASPDTLASAAQSSAAPVAPADPFVGVPDPFQVAPPAAPGVGPGAAGSSSVDLLNLRAGASGQQNMFGSPTAFNLVDPSKTPSGSFLSTIPDWIKYSALNTVGQGAAGAASGWYAGASAEQKLEYDKLVNAQRQQQVNYQNKNNAYAPLLNFAK